MTENTSILDVAEVTNKILFDLNFEEYDTIKKVEFTKSIVDELNKKVDSYYQEMIYSHTCSFEEVCSYITDDTYKIIRDVLYPTGEITPRVLNYIIFMCNNMCPYPTDDRYILPSKINETISNFLESYSYRFGYKKLSEIKNKLLLYLMNENDSVNINCNIYDYKYSHIRFNENIEKKITVPFPIKKYTIDATENGLIFNSKSSHKEYFLEMGDFFEHIFTTKFHINKNNILTGYDLEYRRRTQYSCDL